MFASLPMYDWPETAASTDRYWQLLRESFLDHGLSDAPEAIVRGSDPHGDWLRSDLLLSQTCGLPYVRELGNRVQLVGTPSFDIECGSGSYFSVLIAGENGPDAFPQDADYSVAFNDVRSQSGYAAFLQAILSSEGKLPARWLHSGSHRASLELVATGKADVAAIDAVTWRLAQRNEAHAKRVKIIGHTPQMPGLPYITSLALHGQVGDIRQAISEAIAGLGEADRDVLLLTGFVVRRPEEYEIIAEGWKQIADRGWENLPGVQNLSKKS